MPSHIKHMDKTHKISVISNSPLFQLSVGISFIAQNIILKIQNFIVWRGVAIDIHEHCRHAENYIFNWAEEVRVEFIQAVPDPLPHPLAARCFTSLCAVPMIWMKRG